MTHQANKVYKHKVSQDQVKQQLTGNFVCQIRQCVTSLELESGRFGMPHEIALQSQKRK